MKTYLAILVIALFYFVQADLNEEQRKKLENHHKECREVSGVKQELITKARKGEFVDDPKLKQHMFCVSKKIGFQNQAGDIQKDVLKAKVGFTLKNDVLSENLIKKCAIKKDTPENTAFDCIKCYYENTPGHISIV